MLKRTPLHAMHQSHGGKLVEFGGWEMPVQYSNIGEEHRAVRNQAGIFDISHMGEVKVSGPGAGTFLNRVLTNDIAKLQPGLGQYTLLCNDSGGVVDDLYAYQLGPDEFLLIINASRIEADIAWLNQKLQVVASKDTLLSNISDSCGAIAVQGPAVADFMGQVVQGPSEAGAPVPAVLELRKNQVGKWKYRGSELWVSRTGYTGEDGFELVCPAENITELWKDFLAAGSNAGLRPCGLGARDTLRIEVCYPLYGHELDEQTTPIEAGLGFFVALGKEDFTGKTVLLRQKSEGPGKRLVAFKMAEKSAVPRAGYAIYDKAGTGVIGRVTSGTQSPCLGLGIGMGYVASPLAKAGESIMVEARGRQYAAQIVPKPIYRKQG